MFPAEPALDVLFTELVNPTTSCLLSKAALYKGALPVFPSLSVDCGDFPVFAFLYPPIPFPQQPIMRGRTHTHTFLWFFFLCECLKHTSKQSHESRWFRKDLLLYSDSNSNYSPTRNLNCIHRKEEATFQIKYNTFALHIRKLDSGIKQKESLLFMALGKEQLCLLNHNKIKTL